MSVKSVLLKFPTGRLIFKLFFFVFKHVNLYTEGDTPEHCSFQIYFYSRAYVHVKFTKCKGPKLKSHFQFSITVNFKTRLSTKTFLRKTKEKESRKRKSVEEERRRREKSNGCTLSFYNGYFGDCFWPKKHFWTEKVHLAVTFPKMTVDEPKFNIQNNRTSHAFTCYK